MVWGYMTWHGVEYAQVIEGNMNSKQYTYILESCLANSLETWGMSKGDVIFQQDNDPKHTSKTTRQWLQQQDYTVMERSAQSPDLNPIEHLWSHLKRELDKYEGSPTSRAASISRTLDVWAAIADSTCQILIASMPRRCAAVVASKGGHTKY